MHESPDTVSAQSPVRDPPPAYPGPEPELPPPSPAKSPTITAASAMTAAEHHRAIMIASGMPVPSTPTFTAPPRPPPSSPPPPPSLRARCKRFLIKNRRTWFGTCLGGFLASLWPLVHVADAQASPDQPGTDHKVGWSRTGLVATAVFAVALQASYLLALTAAASAILSRCRGGVPPRLPWVAGPAGSALVLGVFVAVGAYQGTGFPSDWAGYWLGLAFGWLAGLGMEAATGVCYGTSCRLRGLLWQKQEQQERDYDDATLPR